MTSQGVCFFFLILNIFHLGVWFSIPRTVYDRPILRTIGYLVLIAISFIGAFEK
jgi:hypothetical protein